jgi:hypothetical protein
MSLSKHAFEFPTNSGRNVHAGDRERKKANGYLLFAPGTALASICPSGGLQKREALLNVQNRFVDARQSQVFSAISKVEWVMRLTRHVG